MDLSKLLDLNIRMDGESGLTARRSYHQIEIGAFIDLCDCVVT